MIFTTECCTECRAVLPLFSENLLSTSSWMLCMMVTWLWSVIHWRPDVQCSGAIPALMWVMGHQATSQWSPATTSPVTLINGWCMYRLATVIETIHRCLYTTALCCVYVLYTPILPPTALCMCVCFVYSNNCSMYVCMFWYYPPTALCMCVCFV